MIQLRKVRTYQPRGSDKPKSSDTPLSIDVVAPSIFELFNNLDSYIDKIPPDERWNVYYTIGNGDHGDKRCWQSQSIIPVDIDDIDVAPDGSFDERYIDVACQTLGVQKDKVAIVASGHGFHIIIGLKKPISEHSYFKTYRMHYRVLMGNLQAAYQKAGLKATCDDSSFAPNRILRCPGTINRKPAKKDITATLRCKKFKPIDWELTKATGLPEVKEEEQITEKALKHFNVDVDAVEEGCEFLRYCKENPNDLDEPQWYALLSIASRLKRYGETENVGREAAHRYSRNYDGYDEWATDRKIDQALVASGPRTCENIDGAWDGCRECKNWLQVTSPICIKNDTFIATENSGFHMLNEKGKPTPQFEDLCRYLRREHNYITNKDSGGVYIYTGKNYQPWTTTQLRNYAHNHFKPKPSERNVQEFVAWVNRTNLIDNEWFAKTVEERINFNNGILDVRSGIILEHEPTYGFLYCLPFDYSPNAECPAFDSFMDDITCKDKELTQLLLEYIGYAICANDYWLQKGLLLVGDGSNGKSTFLQIVEHLVGRDNCSFLSLSELQNETSRINLEGKLVNISDELPSYNFRNTEMFKKLMGGSVTARKLYQNTTMMQNNTKFIFSCNDIPATSDTSNGLFRRLLIVPFTNRFDLGKNADVNIAKKILPELPGIFNKCFNAYRQLKSRGYNCDSKRADNEVQWYRDSVDRVGNWIKDNIYWNGSWTCEDPYVKIEDAFDRYHADARRSEEKPCTRFTFTRHLRRHIDHWEERYVRHREGECRPYVIRGAKFNGEGGGVSVKF